MGCEDKGYSAVVNFGNYSEIAMLFVYVIVQEGVKFGINFTSCSIATTSGIYPKISLLPVLSQIIL